MTHPKVAGVTLKELDLGIGEDIGRFLGMRLKAQQALVPSFYVVAQPYASHAA